MLEHIWPSFNLKFCEDKIYTTCGREDQDTTFIDLKTFISGILTFLTIIVGTLFFGWPWPSFHKLAHGHLYVADGLVNLSICAASREGRKELRTVVWAQVE